MRRALIPLCALLSFVALAASGNDVGVVRPGASAPAPFTFNWAGSPASPLAYQPATDWDVQIHVRAPQDTMERMDAQHGTDCAPPPAVHPIVNLTDGVFICKNHLMTAINDGGYGEIALTSDHMVDFSSGTATIKVDVSTQEFNSSDWTEIFISPFNENLTLPFNCCDPDLQGPPAHGLRFSMNASGIEGTHEGDVARVDDFKISPLAKVRSDSLTSVLAPSETVRTTYEIDVSKSHVRFGLPGVKGGVWWTDTDISSLTFAQGVVQILHHTYNADKHNPGTGHDTWHWSSFSISNAIPFTILNGRERSIHASGATTVHFPAPSPVGAYLRFSGVGPQGKTYEVSYDGGATWVAPSVQKQQGTHDEHFTTYWSPMPAGVRTVMFKGQDWWGSQWWVRDPAIWSTGAPIPVSLSSPAAGAPSTPHKATAAASAWTVLSSRMTLSALANVAALFGSLLAGVALGYCIFGRPRRRRT